MAGPCRSSAQHRSGVRQEGIGGARGGDYDHWDLEVRGGLLGAARLLTTIEEHGAGKQLVRFRLWPTYSGKALGVILLVFGCALGAASDHAWSSQRCLGLVALLPACRMVQECAGAMATVQHALNRRILQVRNDSRPKHASLMQRLLQQVRPYWRYMLGCLSLTCVLHPWRYWPQYP